MKKVLLVICLAVGYLQASCLTVDSSIWTKKLTNPLLAASREGDLEKTLFLLRSNGNPLDVDELFLLNAIQWAALEGKLKCFYFLLQCAATRNKESEYYLFLMKNEQKLACLFRASLLSERKENVETFLLDPQRRLQFPSNVVRENIFWRKFLVPIERAMVILAKC